VLFFILKEWDTDIINYYYLYYTSPLQGIRGKGLGVCSLAGCCWPKNVAIIIIFSLNTNEIEVNIPSASGYAFFRDVIYTHYLRNIQTEEAGNKQTSFLATFAVRLFLVSAKSDT
jgi:hypothetical protein